MKISNNRYINAGVNALIGIALYEGTAFVLNKTLGVGLPYTPMQMTNANMAPAMLMLSADILVAEV